METNVNYSLVGIFVIFLTGMIVMAIVWLSSGFTLENYNYYVIRMQESVSGLSINAPVEFNGVNVGSVKDIKLSRRDPHLVKLLLYIKASTPVTAGTVATLNSRGVTGLTYVALKDDGNNKAPLIKQPGEKYPVIPTVPSVFNRLDMAMKELSVSLQQVTSSIAALLDKENLQLFKESLRNFRDFTGTLAKNSQNFDAILLNTQYASQQFTPFMQNLIDATRILTDLTSEIRNDPSVLIRGAATQPLGPGEH